MGDRSENAEYIYGKRRLREIDRRVRFLRGRLDGLKVVSETPSDRSRVFFGAWVTIEDADGDDAPPPHRRPGRVRPRAGYISMDSPLGRALLGKRVGDTVEVELPRRSARSSRSRSRAIDYLRIIGKGARPLSVQTTRTFLNCQGSVSSRSSGNSRSRSMQRRPVGVLADDRAEIRHADLEVAPEVDLVGLDDARRSGSRSPRSCPAEHGDRDLQAGGVVVRRELARFVDRQLRAVPVGVLLVAGEQHAELVDARR